MEEGEYEEYKCAGGGSEVGMGILDPFREDPESILLEKELFEELLERVQEVGSDDPEKILRALDPELIQGLTRPKHRRLYKGTVATPMMYDTEILKRLGEMLGQAIGWDEGDKVIDRLSEAAGVKKSKEEMMFKQRQGRVQISELTRKMPLDILHSIIRAAGYDVSRSTIWRAKKQGWFFHSYHAKWENGGKSKPDHRAVGVINLTEGEKNLTGKDIGEKFGVSEVTGWRAKKRGWFQVDQSTLKKGKIPPERLKKIPQAV